MSAPTDKPDAAMEVEGWKASFASKDADLQEAKRTIAALETLCAKQREALEAALASFMATGSTPDGKWTLDFEKFRAAEHHYVRPVLALTPAALRDQLAEAQRERDQWRDCAQRTDAKMLHEQADHNKTVDKLIVIRAERDRLAAEVAELREDRADLDWLEEQGEPETYEDAPHSLVWSIIGEPGQRRIRAAIRAARKEAGKCSPPPSSPS